MAQTIKQVNQQGKPSLVIERFKCNNYNAKKAGEVWLNRYKEYVGDVTIGNDAKYAWNNLILWAFGLKCDIDLTKGIGLVGKTGSGKTITMWVLNDFIGYDNIKYRRGEEIVNLRFKLVSAVVIAADYSREGYDSLYKYSNYANLCIDDLGAENTNRKYFGDSANVIQELIEIRHSNGFMTHFTSNLNKEAINELYGDRVYSRLIGGTNIIRLSDKDYRIK